MYNKVETRIRCADHSLSGPGICPNLGLGSSLKLPDAWDRIFDWGLSTHVIAQR